jgi:hypothetical protein
MSRHAVHSVGVGAARAHDEQPPRGYNQAMRTGETKNSRKFAVVSLEGVDSDIESMPEAPFGALVVAFDREIPWRDFGKLASRLIESGCAWATLHAGKLTHKLHDVFDKAIVNYQLKQDADADMMTSGENEDSLEEAVRDAVWHGRPTYGDGFSELLVLIVGEDKDKLAEQAEALAKSVTDE